MPDEAPPTLDYASRRNTNPPPDDTLRCALPSRPMRRATLICMLLTLASVIALLPAVILANVTLGSNALAHFAIVMVYASVCVSTFVSAMIALSDDSDGKDIAVALCGMPLAGFCGFVFLVLRAIGG